VVVAPAALLLFALVGWLHRYVPSSTAVAPRTGISIENGDAVRCPTPTCQVGNL
jgi:hypothetical protein